jgi:hypothetical protein
MSQQKFHLVGQDLFSGKVDVFGVGGYKWYGQQLHTNLFGSVIALMMIAAFTSCYHILPVVTAAAAHRFDVVSRQLRTAKMAPAVKAQIGITTKECDVI